MSVSFSGTDLDKIDILRDVNVEDRNNVEADSYWCFCKFLDGIQDNYIFPQLGIQHKIHQLRELIQRIDGIIVFSSSYIFLKFKLLPLRTTLYIQVWHARVLKSYVN